MHQFTEEQIEEAALAQHNRRNENYLRRCPKADPVAYEGQEREFCRANAKGELERVRDREWQVQAVIQSMAHMTDANIQYWIDRISADRSQPLYALMVTSYENMRSRETLSMYEGEKLRRTLAVLNAEHEQGRVGGVLIMQAAE